MPRGCPEALRPRGVASRRRCSPVDGRLPTGGCPATGAQQWVDAGRRLPGGGCPAADGGVCPGGCPVADVAEGGCPAADARPRVPGGGCRAAGVRSGFPALDGAEAGGGQGPISAEGHMHMEHGGVVEARVHLPCVPPPLNLATHRKCSGWHHRQRIMTGLGLAAQMGQEVPIWSWMAPCIASHVPAFQVVHVALSSSMGVPMGSW